MCKELLLIGCLLTTPVLKPTNTEQFNLEELNRRFTEFYNVCDESRIDELIDRYNFCYRWLSGGTPSDVQISLYHTNMTYENLVKTGNSTINEHVEPHFLIWEMEPLNPIEDSFG